MVSSPALFPLYSLVSSITMSEQQVLYGLQTLKYRWAAGLSSIFSFS
jgi:hypothetical protein